MTKPFEFPTGHGEFEVPLYDGKMQRAFLAGYTMTGTPGMIAGQGELVFVGAPYDKPSEVGVREMLGTPAIATNVEALVSAKRLDDVFWPVLAVVAICFVAFVAYWLT